MTRRSSSPKPLPFHVPKDTKPSPSGPYAALEGGEQHTLSQRAPSNVSSTMVVNDLPPATRVTRVFPAGGGDPAQAPPTIKRDRPNFLHPPPNFLTPPTKTEKTPPKPTGFSSTMPHHMMIPSFTGTTTLEAMRYEKHILYRIIKSFLQNNAILMAGGVAYNMLLSIIPMFALIFFALSHFFDKSVLINTLSNNLQILIPGNSQVIESQLSYFLENRQLFGGITLVLLMFFSSLAFKVMEGAMSVIFVYDKAQAKRRFWVSATIPYLYILCITAGILILTSLSTFLQRSETIQISILGFTWSVANTNGTILYLFTFMGLGLMLSSLYMVMPKCPISLKRALVGGFVAATLWEITRHILIWYFTQISKVTAIYGPIGNVIVILLSFEIAALIVLLGAQVIAELQRSEIFEQMISGGDVSHIPTR
ncbi:MAG: YihY family inner membrane protein [Deltaproteobacteria bacterium]|nr:MAG: YihY family inner membrane protein [Deltaproteobacteria bacterium]